MAKKEKTSEAEKEAEHKEEIRKALSAYGPEIAAPPRREAGAELVSREYREFKEEERAAVTPATPYEKACGAAGKIVSIEPPKDIKLKLKESIRFTEMRVQPEGVMSLAVLSALAMLLFSMFLFLMPAFLFPPALKTASLILVLAVPYFILLYPVNKAVVLRIKTGGELVIAVLYMVVFIKSTPNLEGAVRFAATNATGKVARDFRRMLWRLENNEIHSIDDGLSEYVAEWKAYNREFMDSIQYVRASMRESNPMRKENLLDKAVEAILKGTDEKMQHYSRNLKMPIAVVHGLGILLPVMGMIIFPLASIFMSGDVQGMAAYLFYGYDIILPVIILFFMKSILDKRPTTKTQVDISSHPDALPLGLMRIGSRVVPVWPFGVATGALIIFFALYMMAIFGGRGIILLSSPMFHTLIIVWGLAAGFAVYYYGTSFQKVGIVEKIDRIESEFEAALFALGNRLSGGTPLESALAKAADDTEDLDISGLFQMVGKNMNQLSMTFRQALFDKRYGALRYYPSRMIRTIMESLAESIEKGTHAAAMTMLVISEYLRSIKAAQLKIVDLLSDTVSSMKFQAFALVPIISAIVVGMADLIMFMMVNIGAKMEGLAAGGGAGALAGNPMETLIDMKAAVPPHMLQLIVGIYVVELLIILSAFITKIDRGEDKVAQHHLAWQVLVVGIIIYTVVLAMVKGIFGTMIAVALQAM